MTCTCPKCNAQIEIDISNIPENGTFTPCPECKSRFWITKESYARMSLKKEGKIYCDKCGSELAHSIVCTGCGIMYPDYCLVQASKPPRRQIEKPDLFSISFPTLKPASPKSSYTYSYTGVRKPSLQPSKVFLKRAGVMALIALLVVGSAYIYHIKQAEKQFAVNYMRALYAIKAGTDFGLNTCTRISAEWKARGDAGQRFVPKINEEEESRLNSIKTAADGFMKKLNKTPKKYTVSKEKLADLYGIYARVHNLAVAPPSDSLTNFTGSTSKSQSDFNAAVNDLKASLPTALSEELQIAKVKYKSLKDI